MVHVSGFGARRSLVSALRKLTRPITTGKEQSAFARRRRLLVESLEPRTMLAVSVTGLANWIPQGPSPLMGSSGVELPFDDNETAGAVETIAPHPLNANVIYVGSVNGGIWKTSNAYDDHQRWSSLTDQFPSLSIGDLKFSPLDPSYNTLFAGIGKYSSRAFDGGIGSGVLRTTDGGSTWTKLAQATFTGLNIRSIVPTSISPSGTMATQVILAATNNGLFRSADGGVTWAQVIGALATADGANNDGDAVTDEVAETNNFDGVDNDGDRQTDSADVNGEINNPDGIDQNGDGTADDAGEFNNLPPGAISHLIPDPENNQRFYAAMPRHGIFRSDDGGLNWRPINVGLNTATPFSTGYVSTAQAIRIELAAAYHPTHAVPHILYAGIIANTPKGFGEEDNQERLSALYFSLDRGATWQPMSMPNDYAGGLHTSGQGDRHFSIAIDPANPNLVYLGGDTTPESDGKYLGRLFVGDRGQPPGSEWTRIAGIDLDDDNYDDVQAPHPDSRDIQFDAAGNMLQADDGGIYRRRLNSSLFGDEWVWESVNGILQVGEVISAVYDSNHNTITVGMQDNGVASQPDEGELEWEEFLGGDGGYVATEMRSDALGTYNATYYSAQNLRNFTVNRIRDGAPDTTRLLNLQVIGTGQNLYQFEGQTDTNPTLPFITPFTLNNVSTAKLLIGTKRLYESTDGGDNLANLGVFNLRTSNNRDDDGDGRVDEGAEDLNGDGDTSDPFEASEAANRVDDDGDGRTDEGAEDLNGDGDTADPFEAAELPIDPISAMSYGAIKGNCLDPEVIWVAAGNVLMVRAGQQFGPGCFFVNRSSNFVEVRYPGDAGPTIAKVRDLAVDRDDWATVYLLLSDGRVLRTYDAGANWTDLTDNLSGFTTDLRTITIDSHTRELRDEVVLVGGQYGVYRRLDSDRNNGARPWTEFGGNLPNAVVTDARYENVDDLLVVGTLGRSAWTVEDMGDSLFTPTVITIQGDDAPDKNDSFRLTLDPGNPLLLQVFVNNKLEQVLPAATVSEIRVFGGAGTDSLQVDLSSGTLAPGTIASSSFLPGVFRYITFDGGDEAGNDLLQVIGDGALSGSYTPSSTTFGDGSVVIGAMEIAFSNLEPVTVSNFANFRFVTPNSSDDLTIETVEPAFGTITGTSGGVPFERLRFQGIGVLTVDTGFNDLGGGDDRVTLLDGGLVTAVNTKLTIDTGSQATLDVVVFEANSRDVTLTRTTMNAANRLPVTLVQVEQVQLKDAAAIFVQGETNTLTLTNSLVVTATSALAGELRLTVVNQADLSQQRGPQVVFNTLKSLRFNSDNEDSILTINQPTGGVFAPPNGMRYEGGTFFENHNDLLLLGGGSAAVQQVYSVGPALDSGKIEFTGPSSTFLEFVGVDGYRDTVQAGLIQVKARDESNRAQVIDSPFAGYGRVLVEQRLVNPATEEETFLRYLPIDFQNKDEVRNITGLSVADVTDRLVVDLRNPPPRLNKILVSGGQDRDELLVLAAPASIAIELYGDAGDDRIWVAPELNIAVSAFGGTGNDVIILRDGADFVDAGEGDDFVEAAGGNDVIRGGLGSDRIDAGPGNDLVWGQISADDGEAPPEPLSGGPGDQLYGQDGDDQLFGSAANDLLDGGAGVDQLDGLAGDDVLFAGTGIGDSLSGGSGNDHLIGSEEGADFDPNFGDSIWFGDRLDGGLGDDRIEGLGGADWVIGGSGNDFIDTGVGADWALGGAGDDELYAGRGLGDRLEGEAGRDRLIGSHEGNDTLLGGPDDDELLGQGGLDRLEGGDGDDRLDGGGDADQLFGDAGNDVLLAGGGSGDALFGGDGDDTLEGADDGQDELRGGPGRDRLAGRGGNDLLDGEAGDDSLDGGPGDDTLLGGLGSDILVGRAQHDTLYGHTTAPLADDSSVDYLYGDFGTNGGEPGSGRDQLDGGQGNDLLFGEGDDDRLDAGPGTSQVVDYGGGEVGDPSDFVAPPPTPPALPLPTSGISFASATLPVGPVLGGRWTEFAGSATSDGVSASPSAASEPSVIVDALGNRYVAWVDSRSGNDEIYVARHSDSLGWQMLAASAHEGGVSRTAGSSRRPTLALDENQQPAVAWTEFQGNASEIRAARFDPNAAGGSGAWVAWGDSLGSSGLSGTGAADRAVLLLTATGPVVAWLDRSAGPANVYAKQFSGGTWQGLGGAAFATGAGVSSSATSIGEFAATTDGARVAVAWSQRVGDTHEIYSRQWDGAAWIAPGGGATGGGVSNTPRDSRQPSLAYFGGALFVAWQDEASDLREIYAARFDGATWSPAGADAASGGGVSNSRGNAHSPRLVAGGDALHLAWADDARASRTGGTVNLFARRWTGSAFAPQLPGDSSAIGIVATGNLSDLALASNPSGQPFAAWTDFSSGRPQVFLRGDTLPAGNLYEATSGASVQSLLDAHDLGLGDRILITGGGGNFTVGAADSGVTILAASGVTYAGAITIDQAADVTLQNLNLAGGVTVVAATRFTLRDSTITSSVLLQGGSDIWLSRNQLVGGVAVTAGALRGVIENNSIRGATGVAIGTGGADSLIVRNNRVSSDWGVVLGAAASGQIVGNDVSATNTALRIIAPFTGTISDNDLHHSLLGMEYAAPATPSGNRVRDNATGVLASVVAEGQGLGFLADLPPNEIYRNAMGVQLNGSMQGQSIHENSLGVTGASSLVSVDLAHANRIEGNDVGVDIAGSIEFQRIGRNQIGIRARDGQRIEHNLIYRNSDAGVLAQGVRGARLTHNTLYSTAGDLVRVESQSSELELRNNVFWSAGNFALRLADDSHAGFFSDGNDWHASGGGQLISYSGFAFTDILDWQADVARYDLRSIGATVLQPDGAAPRFLDRGRDDYRIAPPLAQLRFDSPTVDAALPVDEGLPAADQNLLFNPDFEAGVSGWTVSPGAGTQSATPAAFSGSTYFFAGATPAGFAEQTIDLLAAGYSAAALDDHSLVALFGGRLRSRSEASPDEGQITVTFLDGFNTPLTVVTAEGTETADRWELLGERTRVPEGARFLRFRFDVARRSGANADALLDHAFAYLLPESFAPDLGAYGNLAADREASAAPSLALRSPDLYVDWERDRQRTIRWDSYGDRGLNPVRIDLYRETPDGLEFVTTIAAATPDDGEFAWIPATSGIDFGERNLRIRVAKLDHATVFDRAAESFAIPENTATFFVNDRATSGDSLTTAAGSNRNTGKTAASPKPYPNNVLRIYQVGPGQTVSVDRGDYGLFDPLVISGGGARGDDEGFALTGPAGGAATLRLANPLDRLPVVELDDADFMSLARLELAQGETGLLVHRGSEHVSISEVRTSDNSLDGVHIESSAPGTTIDQVTAIANGRHGIFVTGPLDSLTRSEAAFNGDLGALLIDTDDTTVTNNLLRSNRGTGLRVQNGVVGGLVIVGDDDLDSESGNIVRANAGHGIDVRGNVIVVGNTVSGHTTAFQAGIRLEGPTARLNVVYDNYDGITGAGVIDQNRVYRNSHAGIVSLGGDVTRNVVYSSPIGIQSSQLPVDIVNNLVYGTSTGVWIRGTSGSRLINNTVYQLSGDAVFADQSALNLKLANNVLVSNSGVVINLAPNSQLGFASDYNLLRTATGSIGVWQGANRATLVDWRSAAFVDSHSLSQDPLFVSPLGADNALGYVNDSNDGRDDDFHERSAFGSFHGGTLAPVRDLDSGLPTLLAPTLTVDAVNSPAIDRGRSADPTGDEPLPNGGYINLGAYGGTSQASLSPAQHILVTSPDGGEIWPIGQTFTITWRSHDEQGTVRLELLDASTLALEREIATDLANDGEFAWTIPADLTPKNYLIRATRLDLPSLVDVGNQAFTIPPATHVFYVNDGTVAAGDWTTAPGDNANDGLTPATPKASVRALLEAYDLGSGDVVRVDAGTYALTTNVVITSNDSGVAIEGYHDSLFPTRRAVLNRGSTAAGSWTVEFAGADDVTLSHLAITGGRYGIVADHNVDSDRLTLTNLDIFGNSTHGIWIGIGNEEIRILSNDIHDNVGGIYLERAGGSTVADNKIHDNNYGFGTGLTIFSSASVGTYVVRGNEIYGNDFGMQVSGDRLITVQGNYVHDNRRQGIDATNQVVVVENIVSGTTTGFYGISLGDLAQALRNEVFNNGNGISGIGATISNNRVYHNTDIGILASIDTIAQGNIVYDNAQGIHAQAGPRIIANNVIYDNTTYGLHIRSFGASGNRFENNTIYQPQGDAVFLSFNARNVQLRNNILYVAAGHAINVSPDSELGFSSDYNSLVTTGTGKLGLWEGRVFTDLADWFYELGFDSHSQTLPPQFADVDGPDNQLGYATSPVAGDYGRDDDFHLLVTSPTIDAGDPSSAFSGEPAPNGGRVNLGAYGNTAEAVTSSAQFTQLLAPNGREKFERSQTIAIRWRTFGLVAGGTVDLELHRDSDPSFSLVVATNTPDDGQFDWLVPATLDVGNDYRLRVRANQSIRPEDDSDAPFLVASDGNDYYLNDGSTIGDLVTSVAGDNAFSGKSPDQPMASLNALLAAYDLGPGDVIHVDAGAYRTLANIRLLADDSGVRIEGPTNLSATFDRGNTSTGAYTLQPSGADDVTIAFLGLKGGEYGIASANSSGSDRFTVLDSQIFSNRSGIYLGTGMLQPRFERNLVLNNQFNGLQIDDANGVVIANNQFRDNGGVSGDGIILFAGLLADSFVTENELTGHQTAIRVSSNTSRRIYVERNTTHHNYSGISGSNNVRIIGNESYNHQGYHSGNGFGIAVTNGAVAQDNLVYDNDRGIDVSSSTVERNRVYDNRDRGIAAFGGTIRGNVVYDNGVGIEAFAAATTISGNLVYDQTSYGIWIRYGTGYVIENNTIYQTAALDGIRFGSGSTTNTFDATSYATATLRNNIISTPGIALHGSTPAITLDSDYNTFAAGGGPVARWEGTDFTDLRDWFFETGADQHSQIADPRFVDPDGADNRLGFVSGGLLGQYFPNETLTGEPAFTRIDRQINLDWRFTGCCTNVSPGPGLPADRFSVRWDGYVFAPRDGSYVFYTNTDDGERLYVDSNLLIDQWTYDGGLENNTVAIPLTAGWHAVRYEMHESTGSAYAELRWSGPGIVKSLIPTRWLSPDPLTLLPGDFGADDNLGVATNSPTIDAGDPASYYLSEPAPNGNRVNQGYTGNSALATTSPAQQTQVLFPNGLEKFEVGQTTSLEWQISGQRSLEPVALMNLAGPRVDNWLVESYGLRSYNSLSTTSAIDLSTAVDPAPASVYQTSRTPFGVDRLAYQLPVPDGEYRLRLHFSETFHTSAGGRRFDIRVNGVTVRAAYDIVADVGGRLKAAVQSFDVVATSGAGLLVELVTLTDAAVLSGLELLRPNANGDTTASAAVQVSLDAGLHWTTLDTAAPLDRLGRGRLTWTAPAETMGNAALIRVTANQRTRPVDLSDAPFLVANAGAHYYVDDLSASNDEFTPAAAGNNLASGKSPDQPMRTLRALLAAYDLDPSDVIHVDTGTYRLYQTIRVDSQDSGVRIEGAAQQETRLDRANVFDGRYVVQLTGADNVTFDRLAITGGAGGIYALVNADSDGVTISNSRIFGNKGHGIYFDSTNTSTTIRDNEIHNQTGNSDSTGIYVLEAQRTVIEGNEVFGTILGIYGTMSSPPADRLIIRGNSVHDNARQGIEARGQTLVTTNAVFGHTVVGLPAIYVDQGEASDNVVYRNDTGIVAQNGSSAKVLRNRVFANNVGIDGSANSLVQANQVYSNQTGIRARGLNQVVDNNLVYANANRGILVNAFANGVRLSGNSIYQPVGDAVRIEQSSSNVRLVNNLLWVESGYDISVATDSQTGFASNYNLLHQGAASSASVGFYGNVIRDSLGDWQAATSQDGNSLAADPLWVDLNGADNVLGFNATGLGFDGGLDDNFILRAGSPAIDRADGAFASATDRLGNARADDPGSPNLGSAGGFIDLGAHEFVGSSLDVDPPVIVSSRVVILGSSGNFRSEMQIEFDEPVNPIDALAVANYDFREAGVNQTFGDDDDQVFSFAPAYLTGTTLVRLQLDVPGGFLPAGNYRLIVRGTTSVHDLAGIPLDGNNDGIPGDDFSSVNRPPALDAIANRTIDELTTLDFTVAANDPDAGQQVTLTLASDPPSSATLDPQTGHFVWTPSELDGPGTFTFSIFATDNGSPRLSTVQTFQVVVNEVNLPPELNAIGDRTIDEGSWLAFIASATDPDRPVGKLSYSLSDGGLGTATIDPVTGEFRWRPGETRGPGAFPVTIIVTDDGSPPRSDSETFLVTVNEVNEAPVFLPLGDQFTLAGVELKFEALAFDNDSPFTLLDYSFVGAPPAGAQLDPVTAEFTWTPAANQAGQSFELTFRATDRGSPPLFADRTITITVGASANTPPTLDPIANRTVNLGRPVTFTATATDADVPANSLSYQLDAGAPSGASINPTTGQFSWTPNLTHGVGVYSFTVRVTDNGLPSLDDSQSFTIRVVPAWQNPVNPLNVNDDAFLSPIDALLVINELNDPQFSQPSGLLPSLPVGDNPPPYLDTNGDGFVAPIDALLVINELNRLAGQGEGEAVATMAAPAGFTAAPAVNELAVEPNRSVQTLALLAVLEESPLERADALTVASGPAVAGPRTSRSELSSERRFDAALADAAFSEVSLADESFVARITGLLRSLSRRRG